MTVQFGAADLAGNTFASAKSLDPLNSAGFSVSDALGPSDGTDNYRFTLTAAQAIDLSLSGLASSATVTLYDAAGQLVYVTSVSDQNPLHLTGSLGAGAYYVSVSGVYNQDTPYKLGLALSALASDGPAGHGLAKATDLGALSATEKVVTDRLDAATGADSYSFTLGSAQTINLRLSGLASGAYASITVLDALGNVVATSSQANGAQDSLIRQQFSAGTYYVNVTPNSGSASAYSLAVSTGTPTVGVSGTDQAGGTNATAKSLGTLTAAGATVTDYIGVSGDIDVYKVTLAALSKLNILVSGIASGAANSVMVTVTNSSGGIVYSSVVPAEGLSHPQTLAKGDYYITLTANGGATTGYNLRASATALPDSASNDSSKPTALGPLAATPIVRTDWVGGVATDDYYSFQVKGTSLVSLRLGVPDGSGQAWISITDANGTSWGMAYYTSLSNSSIDQKNSSLDQDASWQKVLAAGTYFIQVHSSDPDKVYTLTASAAAGPDGPAGATLATATALGTLGAPPVSRTDWTGDAAPSDFYSFSLASASTVTLRLTGLSATLSPSLTLLDSQGNIVYQSYFAGSDDENAIKTALAAGTYFVSVNNSAGDSSDDGTYTLSASAVAQSASLGGAQQSLAKALPGSISTIPSIVTDRLDSGGAADWFKFTLTSAQTVNISGLVAQGTSPGGGSPSLSITLLDANLNMVGTGYFDASSGTVLTASALPAGTYYLSVQSNSSAATYSLTYWTGAGSFGSAAAADGAGAAFSAAKALGTLSTATIKAADWVGTSGAKVDGSDTYQFSLANRGRVAFTVAGIALDGWDPSTTATLQVFDAHGAMIGSVSFAGDQAGRTAFLDLDAGAYYVRLTPDDPSASIGYSLALATTPYAHSVGSGIATAGDLGTVGTTAVTAHGTGDDARGDMYRFAVGSDSNLTISVSSATAQFGQAHVIIYDALGNVVEDHPSLDSYAAAAIKLHLAKGIYYISVQETAGVAYQLSASGDAPVAIVAAATGSSLATADAVGLLGTTPFSSTAWVGPGSVAHYYKFTLDKTSRLNAQLVAPGGGYQPSLTIYDAMGNSMGQPSVLGAGTYYIAVAEPANAIYYQSSYSLSLAATAMDGTAGHDFASATAITPTTAAKTVSDWLGVDQRTDAYRFSLSSAQTLNLQFALTGRVPTTGSFSYRIVGDTGNEVTSGTTSDGAVSVALAAGSYFLELNAVYADPTASGSYSLTYWTGPVTVGSAAKDAAGGSIATAGDLGTLSTKAVLRSDYVGPSDSDDYYKFTLSQASKISFTFSGLANGESLGATLYLSDGSQIYGVNRLTDLYGIDLQAGTYYVDITGSSVDKPYQLSAIATPITTGGGTASAPKALGQIGATPVSATGEVYTYDTASNGPRQTSDYYTVSLGALSTLSLKISNLSVTGINTNGIGWTLQIADANGSTVYTTSGADERTVSVALAAGSYKVSIAARSGDPYYDLPVSVRYTLSASTSGSPNGAAGTNLATATALPALGATPKLVAQDWVGAAAPADFYRFTLAAAGTVSLELATASSASFHILDANGKDVLASLMADPVHPAAVTAALAAGTYYVRVDGNGDGTYKLLASQSAYPDLSAGHNQAAATTLTAGATRQTVSDWVGSAATDDFYKITLTSASRLNLSLSPNGDMPVTLLLFDSSGSVIQSQDVWSNATADSLAADLQAGTYYVQVSTASWGNSSSYSLSYWTGTSTIGSSSATDGAGNSFAAARALGTIGSTATSVTDWVGTKDMADFYKFTLTGSSLVTFALAGGTAQASASIGLILYDANGKYVSQLPVDTVSGNESATRTQLAAGTYYVAVSAYNADAPYQLSLTAAATPAGPGTTFATARDLGANPGWVTVSDTLPNDGTEYVHFSLTAPTLVDLSLTSAGGTIQAYLTDGNGQSLSSSDFNAISARPGRLSSTLDAGDYYVAIQSGGGAALAAYGLTLALAGALPPPIASIADVTATEGNSGTTNLVFTVTLSAASATATTFSYATANGTATAGSDYTAASGTLTIAAGATTGTITIPVTGDTTYEPDETIKLTLSNPSGATFTGGATSLTATGTIKNDDAAPVAAVASIADVSIAEGNSGTTNLVFTVTLSAASATATTFSYATANGTATAGSDYTAATGTLTIAAGATTGTITIPVTGDTTYETDETIKLTLSNPSGASFTGGATSLTATGTIKNDDAAPVASVADVSIAEGNSGTTNLVFTVTLSAASATATTFGYATANGTATAGSDYTAASGTLTIATGATTGTITIPVTGDTTYEPDETIKLTLSNPSGATFTGGAASLTATGTIKNDDAAPIASIADVSIAEGNSGTTNLVFTVTLSAASATATTFSYATANGTATAGTDYTAASGTLTIAAGATTGTITIPVTGDTVYEPDETIKLTLSNPSGATFTGGATSLTATGTIKNDDAAPVASVADVSIAEGNSGTTNLVFTVTLSAASATATTFSYATANGTATAGSDYTSASGTLTIAAGATTGTITIPVTGDTTYEPDEMIKLTLSNPSGASFTGGATSLTATGTIKNDDAAPVASIADVSIAEGNSGTTNLVFTVTLSAASATATTFSYATANGTATAGSDYTSASGTLTIAAGATTGTITIPVTGDTVYEPDETIKLTLSNPSGATFTGGATSLTATGTIKNDDAAPIASIADVSIAEGNSGTTNLVFTVTLSAASATATTFTYGTANGTATAGSDYTAATGTLTIAAGATTGTITVAVTGDTVYEPDETIKLTLSNPSGATFTGGATGLTATGTIKNDDAAPVASVADASVTEGNSGTTNLVFTVTLSAASATATTFTYATANGTATAGSDYTAATGTLTIAAGATTGTITIPVTGDTTYEPDETIKLTLSNPSGATFTGGAASLTATGTIKNDDAAPIASIADVSIAEGNSGTTNLVFTVTLSAASATATTFSYATANGTATAGSDYTAATGTLTIAAGATTGTITIPVTGDTTYEPDETIKLTLSNPSGATFTGGATSLTATGTIKNDDAAPVASVADVSIAEGNSGTTNLVFTVTLSAASATATTFSYATANGTATAGSDYTAASGTLTIAAGATTGTITIPVTGDTVYEPDETIKLTLSNPSGATFTGGATSLTATGTIKNDDAAPVALIADVSVTEGNSGTTNLVFTVTLSAASATATTFNYATANGTATAGSDYTAATGTLTIAAGATTGTITIPVTGDTTYEPDETIKLTLSNPSGASFTGGATSLTATGTIKNDDAAPVASVADVSIAEGNSGTTNLVFTVTLSAASATATTFSYATANGTATAGSDYTAASGTLTIAAGATTGTITVAVTGDTSSEANETLKLTLSNPVGATLAGGATSLAATGTISNDDFTLAQLKLLPASFQLVDGAAVPTTPAPIALSSLVTSSVAVNDAIQSYQVIDTNAASGSASLSVNGVKQAASTTITLTAAQFAQTVINSGASGGSDAILIRATSKGGTTGWASLLASTSVTGVPQLSTPAKTVAVNSNTALSALVSVLSAVPATAYQFLDLTPDATSGSLKVGGATQSAFAVVDVMASQLSTSSFVAGANGSSDEIWVRASNGSNWSDWSSLKVSSGTIASA